MTKVSWAEQVEQRTATLERITGAGRDDEQLADLGRIGIAEHRRCDIALAVLFVRLGEFTCRSRADRAHRKMHGIWLQTRGQPLFPGFAENHFANRAVIRQHADDDIAVEQIGNAEFRLQAEGLDLRPAFRTANMAITWQPPAARLAAMTLPMRPSPTKPMLPSRSRRCRCPPLIARSTLELLAYTPKRVAGVCLAPRIPQLSLQKSIV
jgi:hypothetical protein